uniref:Uncharacterized protein n=1 Tax=Oryza barthii TaxID=65489 RepID=A0A0D3H5R5_9ORYZ
MVFSACRFIERYNGGRDVLQSREKDLSASAHLVMEIRRLIDGDREISVRKIHHAQNQLVCADVLI